MRTTVVSISVLFLAGICLSQDTTIQNGYFDYKWDSEEGKLYLDLTDRYDEEFLYVHSLSGGVGSNDIGLDRNQLGGERIVKFMRSGKKVLLVEPNYRYRAISENAREREAVAQAFAQSVIWGFEVDTNNGRDWIELNDFLIRDAHGVARSLERTKQGTYKADKSRSALNMERTRNFPLNTEFDAWVTFTGEPKGAYIRSVTPDAESVTVGMHHSFIELPDDQYEPRAYDPRSGYYPLTFYDYATPIDQPLAKQFITRHRLIKKNPAAAKSEPVEPIIYYIDPGCPEPIKSALVEGARWWNEAFEEAGFIDAFRVEELPEGADPLDVRYNMINWVHRSTRGWSYGSSVTDPRTGEIIKGHVLLGSLRVRQDYMIAQGIAGIFEEGDESSDPLVELALARLRQLSAHEVGHTLGLTHNFASSVNDRASVMDYPHPYIEIDVENETVDLSKAYDTGIGEWDKRMIIYGYSDFPEGADEAAALNSIVEESIAMGLHFISDTDARPQGGGHPLGHLWDNGENAIDELVRIMDVREWALSRFGERTIPNGTYMAYLEQILVPLYLQHRYQVEAVAKMIGGVSYVYNLRGDDQPGPKPVTRQEQVRAVTALINTIRPDRLGIDRSIVDAIPPHPTGIGRNRELFDSHTGLFFDPLAAAEGAVNHVLSLALHPQRMARLVQQSAYYKGQLSHLEFLDMWMSGIADYEVSDGPDLQLKLIVEKRFAHHLINLASVKDGNEHVRASAMQTLRRIMLNAENRVEDLTDSDLRAHYIYLAQLIESYFDDPQEFEPPKVTAMPPGSPIGCH